MIIPSHLCKKRPLSETELSTTQYCTHTELPYALC